MGTKPIKFLWAVGVAGLGVFAAVSVLSSHSESRPIAQTSPLLQRVQALGDLHAVKYTYRDIHDFQTTEEPSQWLAPVPGAEDLVHAVTRNTATMSFDGSVEAGVDLSKAKIQHSLKGITILLPKPNVYTANVSAEVHDMHRGLIWRDISIATTAIEDAKQRFRDTSIRQGILEEAKRNVRERVMDLSRGLANAPVTICFRGDSVSETPKV